MGAQLEYSLENIAAAAAWFWETTSPQRVFAFHGEMGAGKTSLIHALCDAKGVKDAVSSPTFSLINEYRFHGPNGEERIFHMDLYRLRSVEEAYQTGIEDSLFSGAYCFVEWPERAPDIFPDETVQVRISVTGSGSRLISIGEG